MSSEPALLAAEQPGERPTPTCPYVRRPPGHQKRVARGGSALDPQVVASLVGRERDALGALTDREREVRSLMAEGLTNNAIARRLALTGAY
jgi:ATP/maltotriose-dependent transcriptional regulator MalT